MYLISYCCIFHIYQRLLLFPLLPSFKCEIIYNSLFNPTLFPLVSYGTGKWKKDKKFQLVSDPSRMIIDKRTVVIVAFVVFLVKSLQDHYFIAFIKDF